MVAEVLARGVAQWGRGLLLLCILSSAVEMGAQGAWAESAGQEGVAGQSPQPSLATVGAGAQPVPAGHGE